MQFTFWTEDPPMDDMQYEESGVTSASIGRAGECMVAAELELAGHACSFAAEGLPYDLSAQSEDGSLRRIQVKTMCRARTSALPRGGMWRGYCFKSEPAFCDYRNVDVFAFVALDKRVATYIKADQIRTRSISIPEKRFSNEHLRALSLSEAMNSQAE